MDRGQKNLEIQGLLTSMAIGVNANLLEPDQGVEHEVRRLLNVPQKDDMESGKPLSEVHRDPKPPDQAPVPKPGSPIIEIPELEGSNPARKFSFDTVELMQSDTSGERLEKVYQNFSSELASQVGAINEGGTSKADKLR